MTTDTDTFPRSMYVCRQCGWCRGHHTVYCTQCPGDMEKRVIRAPVTWIRYDRTLSGEDRAKKERKILADQGLKYIGENPTTPPEQVKSIQFQRAVEKLSYWERIEQEAARNDDERTLRAADKEVQRWTRVLKENTA